MLSKKQLDNVCLRYGGAKRCRFLEDDKNYTDCHCLKLTGQRAEIDKEVAEFLSKMKQAKQDPALQGVPIGDGGSCQGYPYLKSIRMGYDVPPKKS